jgi:murein peptide amidase A
MTAIASVLAVLATIMPIGRSLDARQIVVERAGDPTGPRVLVIGCMHGNECAGMAVVRALARSHADADLWLVPTLNPDGLAADTRGNARGADLNRDWRTFAQRETRIARTLILRLHPQVTIWFHQHMNLVWAWGRSLPAARRYARVARMRLYRHPWIPTGATAWENRRGLDAFTVELPAGALSPADVRRHVRAVLATHSPSHA